MKIQKNVVRIAVMLIGLGLTGSLHAEKDGWSFAIAGGAGTRTVDGGPNLTPFLMPSLLPATTTDQQTLLTLAQIEGAQSREIQTNESHGRMMFEKQFGEGKNFGLNFGLSAVSAKESCSKHCGDFLRLYLLNGLSTAGSSGTLALAYLGPSVLGSDSYSYNYYTLDLGFNWHFRPKDTLDPYIGIEAGGGICNVSGTSSCTAFRGMGKLGIRYYATPSVYIFTQAEFQSVTFTLKSEDTSATIKPADNKVIILGLGYYI